MKAQIFFGGGSQVENRPLELVELPVPEPKAGEILVRVEMVPNALKVLEKGGRLVMAVNRAEAARVYLRVIRSSLSRWEINLKQGFAFDVV